MKKEDLILIGEIVAPIGIKGEVKVKSYSDDPSRFGELEYLLAPPRGRFEIQKARAQGNMAVLKLKGVDDRNSAEALRGTKLHIEESQLAELPQDTYYLRDLMGLKVYDSIEDEGNYVGTIKDVLQTGPQDIYVIDYGGKDVLVPAVKEFIRRVHIDGERPENGFVLIDFIEGMLD